MNVVYKDDAKVSVEPTIALYKESTLGDRRPIDRPDIFEGMLNNSSIIITAWFDNKLIGISRTLTDYTYVAYLADLAVHEKY